MAPKLVQLLTEWTETFPYDFRDERMMRCLKDMTHLVARGDEVPALQTRAQNRTPSVRVLPQNLQLAASM